MNTNNPLSRNYPEGSPIFKIKNGSTLSASAFFIYNWEVSNSASRKYLPFNDLIITNNNASNSLLLIIDGDSNWNKLIPASTVIRIPKSVLPAFRAIQLQNVGTGTIAANEIEVVAQYVPKDSQDIVQRIYGVN